MTSPFLSGPDDADLSSYDAFINGVPHATFAKMRKDNPVAWVDEKDGTGFWSITRHADILTLNRNHERLSSAHGIRIEGQTPEEVEARRTFQETDPPQHTGPRMHVNGPFSRSNVAGYEDMVRGLAVEILDHALQESEFDAVSMVARRLPMRMLGSVMGLPEEDLGWLVDKGDSLIANTDPDFTDHVLDQSNTDEFRLYPFRSPAGKDLFDYADKLIESRREKEYKDVLATLMKPMKNGKTFTNLEFKNVFALMVSAGNDTTRYSISSAFKVLAENPGMIKILQGMNEEQWLIAIEEFLRWASPTMYFRRTAMEDFEYGEQQIKTGDKVVLWFVSANRDETVFDKPFEIDLGRTPNRHIAFGQGGVHSCLGMWLARMELKVVLQELVKRVSKIEQSSPEAYLRSNFIGGVKSLPIRVEMI